MLALIQRVRRASVTVEGTVVGQIGAGLLVLMCAEQGDTRAQADKLLVKILKLRIFSDEQGKMNRCVQDLDGAGLHGGLLLVSQFTLTADTSGGNPPASPKQPPRTWAASCTSILCSRRAAHTAMWRPASLLPICKWSW